MTSSSNYKVTIVGAGAVGATTAFALASAGIAREIVLLDVNLKRAQAEQLDIMHGSLFYPAADIRATGNSEDAALSDVIVITAGARQKPGQTRIDLAGDTIEIMQSLLPPLVQVAPDAIYLVVANPVDIVTYVCQEISGLSHTQVFGSGTVLDSSRLRTLLAERTGVNPKSIHAYIAGEHGDSEIPLWSSATIGNIGLLDYKAIPGFEPLTANVRNDIYKKVVDSAYRVIDGKGVTNYAIALACVDIITCIARDERRIMPLSTRVENLESVECVCMSLPLVVGGTGIVSQLKPSLSTDELVGLQSSAAFLSETLANFGYGK
ncbi:MAG: L-lactate dehydrogenase [Candidatus Ancillula sp.]|jgi:L-lactate dehydrogenase|nr:L-lactate dehydrogenase [Candidatus Ancillula sp.]